MYQLYIACTERLRASWQHFETYILCCDAKYDLNFFQEYNGSTLNRRESVIWSGPLFRAEFPYLTQMYNLLWHVVISVKRSGVDVKRCAVVSAIHVHLQKFFSAR